MMYMKIVMCGLFYCSYWPPERKAKQEYVELVCYDGCYYVTFQHEFLVFPAFLCKARVE